MYASADDRIELLESCDAVVDEADGVILLDGKIRTGAGMGEVGIADAPSEAAMPR